MDTQDLTADYNNKKIVIGTRKQLKYEAKNQIASLEKHYQRSLSLEYCIYLNAGNTNDFWDEQLLKNNLEILVFEYLLLIFLFFASIICAIQSIKCQSLSQPHA